MVLVSSGGSGSSGDTQSNPADDPGDGIYSLTININGDGTVTLSPDKTLYYEGEVVTLTANPGSGFVFDFWDGEKLLMLILLLIGLHL